MEADALATVLTKVNHQLDEDFRSGAPVEELVRRRAWWLDRLLEHLWSHCIREETRPLLGLVAVGGYGRGELHPHSDVDLLILTREALAPADKENIEAFIALLWDLNLQVGHSIRTPEQCEEDAATDIKLVTNLLEARQLAGSRALYQHMKERTSPERIWPAKDFFIAKRREQEERHQHYHHSAYNLEPNLKNCPGGLRDIQMIGWVIKRHYRTDHLRALMEQGFLEKEEFRTLHEGQNFLWKLRYGLHLLAGRAEDRLWLGHQQELARQFGFRDRPGALAVEQFMEGYYRQAWVLGNLNEMLLQHFEENIVRACQAENLYPINDRFQLCNGYLQVSHPQVFCDHPEALLELFVLLGQQRKIKGVRASTIRLLHQHAGLIDEKFRNHPRHIQLFLELLRTSHDLPLQLRRMHRYGILGRYLPAFGAIIGKMQHDLFHIYTVDAHTLEVLRNMGNFWLPEFREQFPMAARIIHHLAKPELLYIAGLFHDLGKGRGGDHSRLGAVEAEQFCRHHGMEEADTRLISWLVKHHLLMSHTAQRRDIHDPAVIADFATVVGDRVHLDYLYTLTVADICATNPKLWNSWQAMLMRQLYAGARNHLEQKRREPESRLARISETIAMAMAELQRRGFFSQEVRHAWTGIEEDYFLQEDSMNIVRHTEAMLCHHGADPLILVQSVAEGAFEGATQVFIRATEDQNLFPLCSTLLERLRLAVQDARIYTSHDRRIYCFFVLDAQGRPLADAAVQELRRQLAQQLDKTARQALTTPVQRRMPSQIRHFNVITQITMHNKPEARETILEILTMDRPGLLARIGRIFLDHGVQPQKAKITTLGERVNDVFFITDQQRQPLLDPERRARLREALQSALDEPLD